MHNLLEIAFFFTTFDIENAYLKNYLWLSWSKIRQFMMGLHDFGKVAFLQTFMQKTLSDRMGVDALAAINDGYALAEGVSANQAAYIADRMAERLGIARSKWKTFQQLQAIRKMEPAWEKVCQGKFSLTSRTIEQPNGGTREVPCYLLTKTECLYIATKFNDEAKENVSGAECFRLLYNGVKKRCFLDVFVVFC